MISAVTLIATVSQMSKCMWCVLASAFCYSLNRLIREPHKYSCNLNNPVDVSIDLSQSAAQFSQCNTFWSYISILINDPLNIYLINTTLLSLTKWLLFHGRHYKCIFMNETVCISSSVSLRSLLPTWNKFNHSMDKNLVTSIIKCMVKLLIHIRR